MNDKTQQALTELAIKFGTTTDRLWSALLKQATISGMIDIFIMSTLIVGTITLVKFVQGKTKRREPTKENKYKEAEWDTETAFFAWLGICAISFISVIIILSGLSTTISAIFNPEYWALKQILG